MRRTRCILAPKDSSQSPSLLLYSHPFREDAPTIREYVGAFSEHSRFSVTTFNVRYGMPTALKNLEPAAVILHYSLFGSYPFQLSAAFTRFIVRLQCPKIALFQDEMHFCKQRFDLIRELGVDSVGTLLSEEHHGLYYTNTPATRVFRILTGYVTRELRDLSQPTLPDWFDRPCDVGYRGRKLSYVYGAGGREKALIAERFRTAARDTEFTVDISNEEKDRIYGHDWHKFVANTKFALGTMSGTSIFDLTGSIADEVDSYLAANNKASFADVSEAILHKYEGNIPYRMISPRIFEYAALGTAMILFRDTYENIVQPDVHYIPLEKDFSNIESVFSKMRNQSYVQTIRSRVFRDLISSNVYGYEVLVSRIDAEIESLGGMPAASGSVTPLIPSTLRLLAYHHNAATLRRSPGVRRKLRTVLTAIKKSLKVPT